MFSSGRDSSISISLMLTIKLINSSLWGSFTVKSKAMAVKWIKRIGYCECDISSRIPFAFAIVHCEWTLNIMTEILYPFSYVSVLLFTFVDLYCIDIYLYLIVVIMYKHYSEFKRYCCTGQWIPPLRLKQMRMIWPAHCAWSYICIKYTYMYLQVWFY